MIGLLACASAGTLVYLNNGGKGLQGTKCQFCDGDALDLGSPALWEGSEADEALSTITKLIKLPNTQKFRRPRVSAMLAYKRLLSHTANVDNLDLTSSALGQWCLQSLHSSIRDLRIAAR